MRLAALALALQGSPDSRFLQRDLDRLSAEYLIVAPPDFTDTLEPLCAHRSGVYRVALVRTDDVAARHGGGPEGIAKLMETARPKFLLLAGDADKVPTFVRKGRYVSRSFAGDEDLASDHPFGTATGRFPADTAGEIRTMVEKTIEYETSLRPGRWQKKIAFAVGEGGFGETIDALLERQFASVVTLDIPPCYDIELAYAKPASKYCPYPPRFNENARRMLNEGSIFYVYVGHGLRTGFDSIRYKGLSYPIFERKDVKGVEATAGLPILVVIACSTGEFDSKTGDSIGEELFKRRRGPVAFIGGSRTTQPYGNALLGRKLVDQVFRAKAPTIGEALRAAKAAVLEKDGSTFRLQADLLAGAIQGPSSLEPMRQDVVHHYNLLGDPALRIRRPAEDLEMDTMGIPGPDKPLIVTGKAPDGSVEVTFECARDQFFHPVDLSGEEDIDKRVARRYANANNKVLVRGEAASRDGHFETSLRLPSRLKPGRYHVKAYREGSVGAKEVEVSE